MSGKKYQSVAIITSIKATSRASVKVTDKYGKDHFYTVEYTEERCIPEGVAVDMKEERAMLWNTVNRECDNQVEEILVVYKKDSKEA